MRMSIFLTALALLTAGCTGEANSPAGNTSGTTSSTATSSTATNEEGKACGRGGTMHRICLSGTLACVEPYRDAGRSCTDGDQCDGDCRYEGGSTSAPGTKAVGTCQRFTDPCGCHTRVEDGKIEGTLCVD